MNAPHDPDLFNAIRLDPALAQVLSRLAAAQGRAIPAHRFGLTSDAGGMVLADLPRFQRAIELWSAQFPSAQCNAQVKTPAREDCPLIWIPDDDAAAPLLIRGVLAAGGWASDDCHGTTTTLSVAQADEGRFITLYADADAASLANPAQDDAPTTARGWFLRAFWKRKLVFVEAAVATVVVNLLGLATSFYSMNVYDRVIPSAGIATLWVLTIGVLLGIVFEFILKESRSILVDRAFKNMDIELSNVFFNKALSIRMDARPKAVGTFAAEIRQFESVRSTMASTMLFMGADAPFALVFVGVIAMLGGWIAIVPMVLLPIAILGGLAFKPAFARLATLNVKESNARSGVLIETIDGIESVKSVQGEWKQAARWNALSNTLADNELRMRKLSTLSAGLAQTLQQLAYVGLVAAGTFAITEGKLTMGGLIACTIIGGRALSPIAQISQLIVQWSHAAAALKGLEAIMALPSDMPAGQRPVIPETTTGELGVQEVKFAYGPNVPAALDAGALKVAPGERIAVLGSVGSGKSTLVKVLSGLYKPQQGRVFLGGVDMALLAPEFVREHVGYLPQDVRLFHGTLRENISIGLPSPSDEQILAAAALTGLDATIEAHPKGLGLEISEGGRGLSGGQRQLVGLTRLLIAQPKVLLLDEPTASMDGQLEQYVIERLFKTLSPDTTLVVVTHKTALLRYVSRLLIVERGRVVLDGPRDAVLQKLQSANANANANPANASPANANPANANPANANGATAIAPNRASA
jgi:ATP-binding cassette subfamily C protein LapB